MIKECKEYVNQLTPAANKKAMVVYNHARFTVLTEKLIRAEWSVNDSFTDRATQKVINRDFIVPDFTVVKDENSIKIETDSISLLYKGGEFSKDSLKITLKAGLGDIVYHYGDEVKDLLGTARTLDNIDGATKLEHGVISREGFSILDDSGSFVFTDDGWFAEREKTPDFYYFGYGHDYLNCIKDFFKLCGNPPELPRYAFGNWWSRFYPYSEKTYNELMDRFKKEKVPLSVAVIDMDWHLTDIPSEIGGGWTGYTWNRKLFPEPKRFLNGLKKRKLHTTLNVHPADGVRYFEECYESLAKSLSMDPETKEQIRFLPHDKEFMEEYFKKIHHPLEREGVDFWWIDWQQGNSVEGSKIDPLWVLNHTHFVDSKKHGKKGMTFSRYAGPGSHRYPIGFSGDSVTTWDSLDFQPYFTANATNIGYTWWSHDIGGHQKGYKNNEMAVRWIELGVFSPIMRLHSTANAFYGKEPWNYGPEAEKYMKEYLRLRHKLIPYLYTMNHLSATKGIPLIMPLYYTIDSKEAYEFPNEYTFGTKMLVIPITSPGDKDTHISSVEGYLPDGKYYDFFTNMLYEGGEKKTFFRKTEEIPVFVKAGGIVPLAVDFEESHILNPKKIEVLVYTGEDGEFTLYEDDLSDKENPEHLETVFSYKESEKTLTITFNGAKRLIPEDREYKVIFVGGNKDHKAFSDDFSVSVNSIDLTGRKERIYKLLNEAEISYDAKENIFRPINMEKDFMKALTILEKENIPEMLKGAIREIIFLQQI